MPLSSPSPQDADTLDQHSSRLPRFPEVIGNSILADFATVCQNPRATLEDVEVRMDGLCSFCVRHRDWSVLEPILSGKFEYLDLLEGSPGGKTEIAEVPEWISGYVRLRLTREDAFGSYHEYRSRGRNFDDEAIGVLERLAEFRWGKRIRPTVRKGRWIRLLADASAHLENSLRSVYPEVTKNPALALLLLSYWTLHVARIRPEAFHEDASTEETYADGIQELLALFPQESSPELYSTLSELRFGSMETNLLDDIVGIIEYEGEMERMNIRGNERQKIVDGLMERIRSRAGTATSIKKSPQKPSGKGSE